MKRSILKSMLFGLAFVAVMGLVVGGIYLYIATIFSIFSTDGGKTIPEHVGMIATLVPIGIGAFIAMTMLHYHLDK